MTTEQIHDSREAQMTDELKPRSCPMCEGITEIPDATGDYKHNHEPGCLLKNITWSVGHMRDKWQTRPVEDVLRERVKRLEGALKFYANEKNYYETYKDSIFRTTYIAEDRGDRARKALEEKP